ncbi:hypothetical protein ACQWHJ_24700, partial [Salmonella enterica subsp. enterica serovar Infantis]
SQLRKINTHRRLKHSSNNSEQSFINQNAKYKQHDFLEEKQPLNKKKKVEDTIMRILTTEK